MNRFKNHILQAASAVLFVLLSLPANAQDADSVVFRHGDNGYKGFRIPALIQSHKGTILAFAEARKNGLGDTGNIDLVLRRSTDGGKSWGDIITVWDDEENVCGNPAPIVDAKTGRIIVLMCWNNGRDHERQLIDGTSIDSRKVYVTHSDDDGLTWSQPRDITSQVKERDWGWYATGPCHALQMSKGPHKGRIVVSCDHSYNGYSSHIVYSDDRGETWHIGGIVPGGNESTAAQLQDGSILLNMRSSLKADRDTACCRLAAVSHDGGETFEPRYYEKGLVEPVCNGSIINYERFFPIRKAGFLTKTLLFTNPKDTANRINVSISRSDDHGRTWRLAHQLTDKPSAYSDILVLRNRDVAVLYETGERNPYEMIVYRTVSKREIMLF